MEDSYEDKVAYLNEYIALDGTHIAGEDMLTVISLINFLVMKYREGGKPDVTPLQIINAVHKNAADVKNPGVVFLHERLSLMCEIFLIKGSKFRNFGLNTNAELYAEINRIIDTWIPF